VRIELLRFKKYRCRICGARIDPMTYGLWKISRCPVCGAKLPDLDPSSEEEEIEEIVEEVTNVIKRDLLDEGEEPEVVDEALEPLKRDLKEHFMEEWLKDKDEEC